MCRPGGRRCPSSKSKSHGGKRPSRSAKAVAVRALAPQVAEELHGKWADSFHAVHGARAKRVKTTTDVTWINAHGTDQVDIAHTKFSDLPSDWQQENLQAAEAVTGYVAEHLNDVDKLRISKRARSHAGSHIHDEWLKRNTYAKGTPLDVPFSKLPQEEKDKDLDQLDTALRQLEPTRESHLDVFMSTDDEDRAKGMFLASAAADMGLRPGEKVVDVTDFKKRRNGTFEDGSPRWKWSGNVVVSRPPLVEKKPRKPRLSTLEKGVVDSSARLYGDNDLNDAKRVWQSDTPSKGELRTARAATRRAAKEAHAENKRIRALLSEKLPEGVSLEDAVKNGSEYYRPVEPGDDSTLFTLVNAEYGSRELASTADLLLKRMESKHGAAPSSAPKTKPTVSTKPMPIAPDPNADYTSRDTAIKAIRSALKARSGKAWSVRGGTGTAWGWITISAPPKRTVDYRMSEEDSAEIHKLLGIPWNPNPGVTAQSITVADTGDHRREFVARAQGRTPEVVGKQYWD